MGEKKKKRTICAINQANDFSRTQSLRQRNPPEQKTVIAACTLKRERGGGGNDPKKNRAGLPGETLHARERIPCRDAKGKGQGESRLTLLSSENTREGKKPKCGSKHFKAKESGKGGSFESENGARCRVVKPKSRQHSKTQGGQDAGKGKVGGKSRMLLPRGCSGGTRDPPMNNWGDKEHQMKKETEETEQLRPVQNNPPRLEKKATHTISYRQQREEGTEVRTPARRVQLGGLCLKKNKNPSVRGGQKREESKTALAEIQILNGPTSKKKGGVRVTWVLGYPENSHSSKRRQLQMASNRAGKDRCPAGKEKRGIGGRGVGKGQQKKKKKKGAVTS